MRPASRLLVTGIEVLPWIAALSLALSCSDERPATRDAERASEPSVAPEPTPARTEPETIELEPHTLLRLIDVDSSGPASLGPRVPIVIDEGVAWLGLGTQLLRVPLDGGAELTRTTHPGPVRPLAVRGDQLVVHELGGGVALFDPRDGATTPIVDEVPGEPVVVGDAIAMVTDDGLVHAPLAGAAELATLVPPTSRPTLHQPPAVRGDAIMWGAAHGERKILIARASFETVETAHEFVDETGFVTHVAWAGDAIVFAVAHQQPDSTLRYSLHRKLGDSVEELASAAPATSPRLLGDPSAGRAWWHDGGRSLLAISPTRVDAIELDHVPRRLGTSAAGLIWARPGHPDWQLLWSRAGAVDLDHAISDAEALADDEPRPRQKPKPERHGPRVEQARPTVTGLLSPDIVRRIVHAHLGEVELCYRRGRANNRKLAGRLEISFTVDAAGEVTHASPSGEPFADAEVARCVAEAAMSWRFPRPTHAEVVVSYPFLLTRS